MFMTLGTSPAITQIFMLFSFLVLVIFQIFMGTEPSRCFYFLRYDLILVSDSVMSPIKWYFEPLMRLFYLPPEKKLHESVD